MKGKGNIMYVIVLYIIIVIFLGALIKNEANAKKKYIKACETAVFQITSLKRKSEKRAKQISLAILIGLGLYILISGILRCTNGNIILFVAMLYMISYYALEYLPHSSWCVTPLGILCERHMSPILWENMMYYKWVNTKQLLLQIGYKGKGIANRRCELHINQEDAPRVLALLQEHHIVEKTL